MAVTGQQVKVFMAKRAEGQSQATATFALPKGYQPERTEITIHGRCPRCAG